MLDYLIVGSGFFGSTFARLATQSGKKCLVIDNRDHIGGNSYTENRDGIDIHVYGPHIFHTSNETVWNFLNNFSKFNNFVLNPKVKTNGKIYSLPFNMNTFYEMWGCQTPEEARQKIERQKLILNREPKNLEEQALCLVGKDIYEILIKEYTKKQWKKDPKELPASIIKRLPVRYVFDNNYFNDTYQGIPVDGYTKLFENMLKDIPLELNVNYFDIKNNSKYKANIIVFTGKIDEFFNYEYGELEYRSLSFQHEKINIQSFQGAAVVNYSDSIIPYTRIIEHKHFTKNNLPYTIITKETPIDWNLKEIPYYPINDLKNMETYLKYKKKADEIQNVIFGGRLAEYKYYDMHNVVESAFNKFFI